MVWEGWTKTPQQLFEWKPQGTRQILEVHPFFLVARYQIYPQQEQVNRRVANVSRLLESWKKGASISYYVFGDERKFSYRETIHSLKTERDLNYQNRENSSTKEGTPKGGRLDGYNSSSRHRLT